MTTIAVQRGADDDAPLAALLDEAVRLFRDGRAEGAVAKCERLAAMLPDRGESWFLLGACRYRAGDAPGAVDAFRRAVSTDPTDPRYHLLLGRALLTVGNAQAAAESFACADALVPNDVEILLRFGRALRAAGMVRRGLRLQREGLALLFRRALDWLRGDLPRRALAHILAIDRPPAHRRAHAEVAVAQARWRRGEVAPAAAGFARALAHWPNCLAAHRGSGLALHHEGAAAAARTSLARAVRGGLAEGRTLVAYADTLACTGHPAEAEAILAGVEGRDGADADALPDALLLRGRLQIRAGNVGTALATLQRALDLRPADSRLTCAAAEACLAAGRRAEALSRLEAALLADPGCGEALLLLTSNRAATQADARYLRNVLRDSRHRPLRERQAAHAAAARILEAEGDQSGARTHARIAHCLGGGSARALPPAAAPLPPLLSTGGPSVLPDVLEGQPA